MFVIKMPALQTCIQSGGRSGSNLSMVSSLTGITGPSWSWVSVISLLLGNIKRMNVMTVAETIAKGPILLEEVEPIPENEDMTLWVKRIKLIEAQSSTQWEDNERKVRKSDERPTREQGNWLTISLLDFSLWQRKQCRRRTRLKEGGRIQTRCQEFGQSFHQFFDRPLEFRVFICLFFVSSPDDRSEWRGWGWFFWY